MSEKNNMSVAPEGPAMTGKIDYDELRRLFGMLEEKHLAVFELETEGLKVKIARNVPPPAPAPAPAAAPAPGAEAPRMPEAPSPAQAAGPVPELAKGHRLITSPMVGTFYRAPD